ncbi:hypothetical protein TOPH_08112 [Tolypocladium ophioglossoides CBS 100239]|uniref:Uncharacterized protein n=1 Tax=Tolypocladium ophioglossoides (strain CBS 100239) TaxID=1163406 RepID=A0A0L0N0E0_TOLOC|nr:hypothetical protein TOPH_08112 [Tolypocladium ophioglossoides CBS 100239]
MSHRILGRGRQDSWSSLSFPSRARASTLPFDEYSIFRQPNTRPISREQLVAEVKGIYAGLVMIESKCIEYDSSQETNQLSQEQYHALIALHRSVLHEHHDFFLASQHPSASEALRRLASKYAMPARMWRHGIHSFLELLRHKLPDSLEFGLVRLAGDDRWCAGHMYYRGASEKKATYWKPWPYRQTAISQAISKYNSRGYELARAKDTGPITRRLQDGESLLLDFGDIYRPFIRKSHHSLLDTWLTERRENIDGITWTEFDRRIFSMQDTIGAYFRRCETTFASHAVDLPLNRLRRLANLISLNAEGSDSLKSDAFRSSIALSLENREWQLPELVRSGTVFCGLRNSTPWSWAL